MKGRSMGRRVAICGALAAGLLTLAQVASAISYGKVSAGDSVNLTKHRSERNTALPPGKTTADIVAVGISPDSKVYTLYRDKTYSVGTSNRLDAYSKGRPYTLPTDMTPDQIVGFDVNGKDQTFAFMWFSDGSATRMMLNPRTGKLFPIGSTYGYTLPGNLTPSDIVGVALDDSNDLVFAYYRNGTTSAGASDQLASKRAPKPYKLAPNRTPSDVVGMAIHSANHHVYAFYK